MKHLPALLVIASLLWIPLSRAGEVLFEDLFGLPLPLQSQTGDFNVFSGEGRNPPTLVGDFNRVEKWKTTKAAAIRDTT